MYKNGLVTSLKVNDKFLKESENGEVQIPFLSEYSIFLKNMFDEKALVQIKIDGRDILNGKKLIVYEKSTLELDGFIESDNIAKNKFKFIKRTDEIESFRGIKPEDSLIEIFFDFEKKKEFYFYHRYIPYIITTTPYEGWTYTYGGNTGDFNYVYNNSTMPTISNRGGISNSVLFSNIQDIGITVEGSETHQPFGIGYVGELQNKPSTIILKLCGFDSNEENKNIYTKEKIQCKTCGQLNKSHFEFCSRCGTNIKV